jgi:N-acetylglucosamine kinase-like BadF-type ATPase
VLSGSTRLKAGTATKLVLNMLTTGAMVRLGKTFGNLMVDLRATNNKLRARSKRIVRQVTGLAAAEAEALLKRCDGELKTALVSHLAAVDAAEAKRRLDAAGGQVGRASRERPRTEKTHGQTMLIGIDGGGTHTVALLADAVGTILGRGEAGPSNLSAVGPEKALAGLGVAIEAAFAAAGIPKQTVQAACLGLAGADRAGEQTILRQWADRVHLAESLELTNDAALVIAAGTPDNWGLALIAGTGSIAIGRTLDGRTARAGGWGYLFGDEGSGYRLVLSALEAVAQAADGRGPATSLTEAFLTRLQLQRPQELIPAIYRGGWDRTALAALAPLVFGQADDGDAVAKRIMGDAAKQLATSAAAAAHQLGWTEVVPLALAGGCLLKSHVYQQGVLEALQSLNVKAAPVSLIREPALGAVRLAQLGLSRASVHQ